MSLKKGCKKLVSVLVTSMPMIRTRKKAIETARAGKDDAKSEGGKYLENLIQVLCI